MIRSINACLPSILSRRMLLRRARLPLLTVKILAVRSTIDCVVIPEQAAFAQFWK